MNQGEVELSRYNHAVFDEYVLYLFICLFLFPLSELTEKETSLQMQGGQNFAKEDVRHSQENFYYLLLFDIRNCCVHNWNQLYPRSV